MIPIYQLNKEQRICEIVKNILHKNKILSNLTKQYSLPEMEISRVAKEIEFKTYFISESSAFEYNNRNYTCSMFTCPIDQIKKVMNTHSEHFYVLYNISASSNSYLLRGCFIYDQSLERNKIISQILKK